MAGQVFLPKGSPSTLPVPFNTHSTTWQEPPLITESRRTGVMSFTIAQFQISLLVEAVQDPLLGPAVGCRLKVTLLFQSPWEEFNRGSRPILPDVGKANINLVGSKLLLVSLLLPGQCHHTRSSGSSPRTTQGTMFACRVSGFRVLVFKVFGRLSVDQSCCELVTHVTNMFILPTLYNRLVGTAPPYLNTSSDLGPALNSTRATPEWD
eukprot:5437433-Amphidinium_carterae.1